ISSQHPKQVILQRAESTWYGCQLVPGAISAVLGSKSTTRERRTPVPTLRQSPLVVGNFANGTHGQHQSSYLGRRLGKTRLIRCHGPVRRLPVTHRGAATATVLSRKLRFFPHSANYFGNFPSFFL